MKLLIYNFLNIKKWFSNSTIESLVSCLKLGEEVNLYCFYLQGYLPFYDLKNMNLLFYFSSIYLFKKMKTKK